MGKRLSRDISECETYCSSTPRGLSSYRISSLNSFPSAHLLWTTVLDCTTKAGSSHLNEDLSLLTSSDLLPPVPFHTARCWTLCTLPNAQPPGQKYSSRGREEKIFRLIHPLHNPRCSIHWVTLQIGPGTWTHHEYRVVFPPCSDSAAVLTGAVNQSNFDDISPWIKFGTLFG